MNTFDETIQHVQLNTLLDRKRLWMIWQLSRMAATWRGDIAEVGVYRGGTSVMLARANPEKTIRAYDTFTGIPSADATVDVHAKGDFDLGGVVPAILTAEPNIVVHPGLFPDTFQDRKYCFAHFDGDTYQTCQDFLICFSPQMARGGVMMFDDYKWHKCPGVERALLEWFMPNQIIETATYQAAVFF